MVLIADVQSCLVDRATWQHYKQLAQVAIPFLMVVIGVAQSPVEEVVVMYRLRSGLWVMRH